MWTMYAARGNGKSTRTFNEVILPYFLTKGKKKKSFIKWLFGFGIKKDIICDYEKWIRDGKGKYSYDWPTFLEYVHNNKYPFGFLGLNNDLMKPIQLKGDNDETSELI